MSDSTDAFAPLLARAREGDANALTELVRHYEPEVRTVARVHLGLALRPFLDSMDVVQSVHQSLLLALKQGKFELHTPQDLVALTVTMVRRKVAQHWRRAQRRQHSSLDSASTATVPEVVASLLGAARYLDEEVEERTAKPGVAIGLAWTAAGGEVLFVEATKMQGSATLTLTGQLGDVMKESARAALSWLRRHAEPYNIDPEFFKASEIHLHVPSGAIPKDGPSAGVTMVTALASELTGRPVRGDLAMTGEITLSGRVLPVGGIKEKVLAARRHGIREVILPRQNEKNIKEDLTEELRNELTISYVSHIEEVLKIALTPGAAQTHSGLPMDEEIQEAVQ